MVDSSAFKNISYNDQLNTILESIAVPVYYKSVEGTYLGCNKAYLELLNKTREEIIGKNFFDFVPFKYAKSSYEDDQKLLAKPGKQKFKAVFPSDNGNVRNVTIHKSTFSNDDGDVAGIIGTIIDTTEEDRLTNALNESEKTFRELTETTPTAVLIYQNNRFVYVNKAASEITEYVHDDLIGMEFWKLIHQDDVKKVKEFGTKRQAGEKTISRYQFRIITKTGHVKFVDLAGSTTIYNGKTAAIISVNDITDMEKSNEELRESKERLNFLANVTFEGIVVHKRGIVVDANESFLKMSGYSQEEILGENLLDYIPLARDKLVILAQIVKKRAKPYIITAQRKDGTRFMAELEARDVKLNGKTVRIAAIRDVTERLKTERALQMSDERLKLALDGAKLGLWDMDYVTGEVYRSETWAEMLGYKIKEITNNESFWENLIHPDDRERVIAEGLEVRKTKGKYFRSKHRLRCKDGSYKWVLSWGTFIGYDKAGNPLRSVGVHIDIDKIQKAEEEIQRLLKSKEILLKEVHHRIKNNMSAIASFLSIEKRLHDNEEVKRILTEANTRVKAMTVLYDKLYRSETYKSLEVAEYLSTLVEDLVKLYSDDCEIHIIKDLQEFEIDAKYFFPLGIIINEIVTNSLKYAFKGCENNELKISCRLLHKKVVIRISDNGCGFTSLDQKNAESGFGLQLVDMLISQLKGKMIINSSKGTEFLIEFDV